MKTITLNTTKFGVYKNQNIDLYTLENKNGIVLKITNYGATITSLQVPDSKGNLADIVCGFDTLEGYFSEDYKANAPYFGCTVGRYTSQIKDSKFSLNGTDYVLAKNCGENNLHGGAEAFDKKVWSANPIHSESAVGIEMSLTSPHMEEGYPGNVKISVTFLLHDTNALEISYKATTDQDTPLSLTNHTYFNLSNFEDTVEAHHVKIAASKKLELDETGAATGVVLELDGAADDLRSKKEIGAVHTAMSDGFEHYYLFDKNNFELENVASFSSEKSGRSMEVATSEPGMLFYTGKYTSDALSRESGASFGKFKGFCCETHRYPNGPNIQGSPKSILNKDEVFESTTVFKFNW
ncbi:MAG: aldose epimerase family protein [Flavicella sp.]